MKNHYTSKYFKWQKKAGKYGGQQDVWKFKPYIFKADTVLDFGCGGGYILEKINCKEKYGIEVNKSAIKEAKKKNIKVFKKLSELPKSLKFDVIFSHHTLEHLENPSEVLKHMKSYLKNGGICVHVLPISDWRNEKIYDPEDINNHLFSWTPKLLGNLFVHLGYKVKDIKLYPYQWLPLSRYYYDYIPNDSYYFLCKVWGTLLKIREIKIIATPK